MAFPLTFSLYKFVLAYIHALLRYQPLQYRKQNCRIGASFKASSHQLGSAIQRTVSCSIAYRHTSERIHQRYYSPARQPCVVLIYLFRPDFILAHQCAIRCRSPDEFLAMLLSFDTDCLQFTPMRLAKPLRPGFLPSSKFSFC